MPMRNFCTISVKHLFGRIAPGVCILFLLLISLSMQFPGMSDVKPYYLNWIDEMRILGPIESYRQPGGFDQYPPLAVSGAYLINLFFGLSQIVSWKIFGAISLFCAAEFTYHFTKSKKMAFYPVAILGIPTLWWGYADIHYITLLLISLFLFLDSKFVSAGFFFAVCILFKWQPIILIPGIVIFMWFKCKTETLIKLFLGPFIVLVLILLIYGWYNPLKSIWLSLLNHYFSAWGPNLYWIVTWVLSTRFPETLDNLGIWAGGPTLDGQFGSLRGDPKHGIFLIAKIIFYVSLITYLVFFSKKAKYSNLNVIRIATASALIYWQLSTGVHTNHIFLLVPLSMALITRTNRYQYEFIVIYGLILSNLFMHLGYKGNGLEHGFFPFSSSFIAVWLSFISVLISCSLLIILFKDSEMTNLDIGKKI